MLHSHITQGSRVPLPPFAGERIYMLPFQQAKGLPKAVSHWQATVDAMLEGIKTDKDIYLMVDQRFVKAKTTHRRPGLHIDGYWMGDDHGHNISTHGHNPGHGHVPQGPRHGHSPRHSHGVNRNQLLILASNEYGCDAFTGEWDESHIGSGGDCSNLDCSNLRRVRMDAGYAWVGDAFTLHQSVPHEVDVNRTVVRLNVPME